jgi:hypothetical protein
MAQRGATTTHPGEEMVDERVILRPLPKVVFLYPITIVSFLLGLLVWLFPGMETTAGTIFLIVALLNFLVLAFDFPKAGLFTLGAVSLAFAFAIILVSIIWKGILSRLLSWILGIDAVANARFYTAFGVTLTIVLLAILIVRRWSDYVEISPMEVEHRLPFGQKTTLRIDQIVAYGAETPDVFEYLFLQSGRIWIQPQQGRTLVVEHVPRVNLRQRQIGLLLSHIDTHFVSNAAPGRKMR